jgi:methylphosphotriester-DNA--protein-cysteine methyltransferase
LARLIAILISPIWQLRDSLKNRSKNRVGAGRARCQNSIMNDYERVAIVIRYLDRHHTEQPDLTELARSAGLSPFHFHRLFSAWAGVTPKDFLQCLTLEHVKTLLRNGESVVDTALNAGLSGPGRLQRPLRSRSMPRRRVR